VSLMGTLKPLRIAVALPTASPQYPTIRKWIYKEDKALGYRYFITEDKEAKKNWAFLPSETASALLRLVNPSREITAKEVEELGGLFKGASVRDDLEPKKVEEFLNLYGQIGRADYARREKLSRPLTLDQGELSAEQFKVLCGASERGLVGIRKEIKENPQAWRNRVRRLADGLEIPFSWIEKDLFDLAKSVRILGALEKNWERGVPFYSLTIKRGSELNRFLIGADLVVIPFGKDERYQPLSDLWSVRERVIEAQWEGLASNLNRFVSPVSRNVFSTKARDEIAEGNSGIETWLICHITQTTAKFAERRCLNRSCQKFFFNERKVKRFCSDSCATTQRSRNRREREKNSSGKSQKKAQAKGKKKNG